MNNLSDLRKTYQKGKLDEASAQNKPLDQFRQWFEQAIEAKVPEPNAMTLATVDTNGRPSTRVVLIKDFDETGLVWYTNYSSRKGCELSNNPYAALQFHWVELERVVRIEGLVEKVDAAESDAYFESRPLSSRIGAWASDQSSVIPTRAVLVSRAAEFGLKYRLHPPRPPHWGGFRLKPDQWEFWQGRPSRLHDRLRFRISESGAWIRDRLAP